MTYILHSKGRVDTAYIRVVGDPDLAFLLSKVQGTTSRNGTELIKILKELIKAQGEGHLITLPPTR